MVDTSNLQIGQVFSSKAKLYRAIGIEPTSGMKNRTYQDRDVRRYISFKQLYENKKSIIITEIFLEPKVKTDNRGKHGNQTGNSIYSKEMDLLVLAMMQNEEYIDAPYNTIFTQKILLFTKEYEKSRLNNSFCMSTVLFIEQNTINTYLRTATTKVLGAFLRSLDRLKKNNIIDYECIYKVIYSEDSECTTATDDEVKIIKKVQNQVYERLEIDPNHFIPYNLRLQCRKEIIKKLREDTKLYSFWNSYNIILVDKDLKTISEAEIKSALQTITEFFIISTHLTMNTKTAFTTNGGLSRKYTPFTSREQITKIIKLDSLFWIYNRAWLDSKTPFYRGQYLTNDYSDILIKKYNNLYELRTQITTDNP